MKYIMSGESYAKSTKEYFKHYYKNEFDVKRLLKIIIMGIIVLGTLCFVSKEMRKTIIPTFILVAVFIIFWTSFVIFNYFKGKKNKNENGISEITHDYKEEYVKITVCYTHGSVSNKEYAYKDIKKISVNKNYIFIFINEGVAIPLDKSVIEDKNEFMEFIKAKVSNVKEYE